MSRYGKETRDAMVETMCELPAKKIAMQMEAHVFNSVLRKLGVRSSEDRRNARGEVIDKMKAEDRRKA